VRRAATVKRLIVSVWRKEAGIAGRMACDRLKAEAAWLEADRQHPAAY